MLPPSPKSPTQLNEERSRIAAEHASARQRAEEHRQQLQSQQDQLGQLESEMEKLREVIKEAQSALAQFQEKKQALHQETMNLARGMGPLHQDEKRLELELTKLDQRIKQLAASGVAPAAPGGAAPVPLGAVGAPAVPAPPAAPVASAPPARDAEDEARAQRFNAELEVEVSETSSSNFYTGFTRNISEGGLFIATARLEEIGSEITFRLQLPPSGEALEVTAIVRWVREYHPLNPDIESGMGVQFINLSDSTRSRIQAFIETKRESLFFDED